MTTKSVSGRAIAASADSQGRFDRKLVAYAAAAGAAVIGAHSAEASLSTRAVDIDVFNESKHLDVDGNGIDDFTFSHTSGSFGPFFEADATVSGIHPSNGIAGEFEEGEFKASVLP